jgi:hypothetical protein
VNNPSSPPATPRPFPLSPPTPSRKIDRSPLTPIISDPGELEEFLPPLEKLLADTRPAYATPTKSQRSRQKSSSTTVAADRSIKMDVDTQLLESIKQQPPESSITTSKLPKKTYNEITQDHHTYIEILSSESVGEPPASTKITSMCSLSAQILIVNHS